MRRGAGTLPARFQGKLSNRMVPAKTAYLDTANWIDLANGGPVADHFERAVGGGRIVLVLSITHLIELARIENASRRVHISEYMDRIDTIGSVIWIHYEPRLLEVVACFRDIYGSDSELPTVLFDTFFETLLNPEIEKIVGNDIPRTISDFTEVMRSTNGFMDRFHNYRGIYPRDRQAVAKAQQTRGSLRSTDRQLRLWIASWLPSVVELPSGTAIPIDSELRAEFASRLNPDRCPAFLVDWAFHEGATLDPSSAHANDIADNFHLGGVAYCDVAFVDRGTAEKLRKGRYSNLPRTNGDFPEWIRCAAEGHS